MNQFFEKKVTCRICGRYFRNQHALIGHSKVHNKKILEHIRRAKLGDLNPAKRLDVRIKISNAAKGRIPWNKNKKWTKDTRHNKWVNSCMKKFKAQGLFGISTHHYVPDAIIIDFKKRTVKAFEFNPGSIISKQLRAKEKGYHSLIVKIRRNLKYRHKNTDQEIFIKKLNKTKAL